MFEVVYILKKGPEMAYQLFAKDAVEARQKADQFFAVECAGSKVKKVTVRPITS